VVGAAIEALRPPAHSTWATFSPPRSADWAIDSTWRTPGSNAVVRFVNGWPLMWNVLFVEPWTPGQAPVANVYQPEPVFGGAWVSRPLPEAIAPDRMNEFIVGMRPCRAYLRTRSWRSPSEAKNTAESLSGGGGAPATVAGTTIAPVSRAIALRSAKTRVRAVEATGAPPPRTRRALSRLGRRRAIAPNSTHPHLTALRSAGDSSRVEWLAVVQAWCARAPLSAPLQKAQEGRPSGRGPRTKSPKPTSAMPK